MSLWGAADGGNRGQQSQAAGPQWPPASPMAPPLPPPMVTMRDVPTTLRNKTRSPQEQYRKGDAVFATGLTDNATFNGCTGTVLGKQPGEDGKEYVMVKFDGVESPKMLSQANLRRHSPRDHDAIITVTVTRGSGVSDLGCLLSDMVLRGVRAGSAAEKCGVGRMVGMRLTHVNKIPVASKEAAHRASDVTGPVLLQFEGSPTTGVDKARVTPPARPPLPPPPPPPTNEADQQLIQSLTRQVAELRSELAMTTERETQRQAQQESETRLLRIEIERLAGAMAAYRKAQKTPPLSPPVRHKTPPGTAPKTVAELRASIPPVPPPPPLPPPPQHLPPEDDTRAASPRFHHLTSPELPRPRYRQVLNSPSPAMSTEKPFALPWEQGHQHIPTDEERIAALNHEINLISLRRERGERSGNPPGTRTLSRISPTRSVLV